MAKDQSRRIAPNVLEADRNGLAALQAIADYAPANPTFELTKILNAQTQLAEAQRVEAQTAAAAAAARDNAVAKEWEFHNLMIGAKDQVMAQFGRDSNEVQALGLKKLSERRSPVRRSAVEAPSKAGSTGQA